MAFNDDIRTWRQRALANTPEMALGGTAQAYRSAAGIVSAYSDMLWNVQQSGNNMFVSLAKDAALDLKLADIGVARSAGLPAAGTGFFQIPNSVSATLTYPAGTRVGTTGDAYTSPSVAFVTTAVATIGAGSTSSNTVPITCTVPGIVGNVGSGQISQVFSNANNGAVVFVSSGTAGGTEPDTDAAARAKGLAALIPIYGASAVQAAIDLVPLVWDSYVADPQDGSGTVHIYWADASGNQPGLTYPAGVPTIAPGTLAATVDVAVRAVLPPNILPVYAAFTVVDFTVVPVQYSAPASQLSGALNPLIQAAVAAYIQGLVHNQTPTNFGMINYIESSLGNEGTTIFTDFRFPTPATTTTPATPAAANTTLCRLTGTPATVVVITRV